MQYKEETCAYHGRLNPRQLANTAEAAKEAIGAATLEAVADRGCFNGEEIKTSADAGIAVTLPKPLTSWAKAEGRFG
jgi:hypothetical protein